MSEQFVHVAFAGGALGCLRQAFRVAPEDFLLLEDDLSAGPISGLDTPAGQRRRSRWWRKILSGQPFHARFKDGATLRNLRTRKSPRPYLSWCGPNATEQLGLRRFLSALPPGNSVWVVLWSKADEAPGRDAASLGQCTPAMARILFERRRKLSSRQVEQYKAEWEAAVQREDCLRSWSSESVVHWSQTDLDARLIQAGATDKRRPLIQVRSKVRLEEALDSEVFLAWRVRTLRSQTQGSPARRATGPMTR